MTNEVTQERLKQLYRLNDKNEFIGIVKGSKNYNKIAGAIQLRGQARIMIDRKSYTTSRLLDLYITGIMPDKKNCVDNNRNTVKRTAAEETDHNKIVDLLKVAWI